MSGITFIGNFTHIAVSRAQEVMVSECNFQGVSLSLRDVTNATISRCNFFDHHRNSYYYYYTSAALYVRDLNTVTVVQCNFSNTERAIAVHGYIRIDPNMYVVTDNSLWSLNIRSCTFINTWGGSAVTAYISVYYRSTYYYYSYPGYTNYMVSQLHATLDILNSTFINNTSKYYGSAVYFRIMINGYIGDSMQPRYHAGLNIAYSTFINNTYEEGGAVHFRCYNYAGNATVTLFVHQSVFIGNTAYQKGGAMDLDGCHSDYIISESNFTENSAKSCGALSITKYYDDNVVQISDCIFSYNNATSIYDIGGGAVCITNTIALISNSRFVENTAVGFGGAMVSHDSMVIINHTVFHSNSAGGDGGALITYARPSNYTITQSSFTDNQAGDDGGAIFIGHRESYVTLEMCTFTDNHAIDRGDAITIFGSTIEITGTTIDNNRAVLGEAFSSCNSNVVTSIHEHRDLNCSYDGPTTNYFNATKSLKGQSFSNITLDVTIGDFCASVVCNIGKPGMGLEMGLYSMQPG